MAQPRVALFVDGLNMRNRLRESGWPEFVDVAHLGQRLAGNRNLVICHYCVGRPELNQLGNKKYWSEIRYYTMLEKQSGMQVQYGYMVKRGQRWVEKRVDVLIASKMIEGACRNQYDVAILVTADGDLVPAVESVVALGKKVELLVFTKASAYSGNLVKVSSLHRSARKSHFVPL